MGDATRAEQLAAACLRLVGIAFILLGLLLPIGYSMAESDSLGLLAAVLVSAVGAGALLLFVAHSIVRSR